MSRRHGSDLQVQALRLPQHARERLATLTKHLSATGVAVSVAEATRGLCMVTLDIARGAAGPEAADAFRIAASEPRQVGVRRALDAFVLLLDTKPSTTPLLAEIRSTPASPGEHPHARKRGRRNLDSQALRLPQSARGDLETLTSELCAAGARVSEAEVMRRLCLLALDMVDGAAGAEVSEAFCVAAGDPSAEGALRAVETLRALLDSVPSTIPDPPTTDGPAPTRRSGDSLPPSTTPGRRAA